MDARGFLIGSVLAHQLNKPLILFRKQGKLPADVIAEGYQTEYGEAFLEAHADSLCEGDSLLIVDDLIATGGTLIAAANLARRMGATVFEAAAIIDLPELGGSKRLNDIGISTFSLTDFSLTDKASPLLSRSPARAMGLTMRWVCVRRTNAPGFRHPPIKLATQRHAVGDA